MTGNAQPSKRNEPVGVCRWCAVILLGTTVARPDGSRRHLGCK